MKHPVIDSYLRWTSRPSRSAFEEGAKAGVSIFVCMAAIALSAVATHADGVMQRKNLSQP